MRKTIALISILLITALFTGCGNQAEKLLSSVREQTEGLSAVAETVRDQIGSETISSYFDTENDAEPAVEDPAYEETAEDTEDPSVSEETEVLTASDTTVADLKALDYSLLKTRAISFANQLLNKNVAKNTYDTLSFKHNGSFLTYEDEEYDCLLGIDVSVYQGEIDWAAVKEQGISFAIIRAGFRGYGETGSLNEDESFRQNIEGAKEAGLLVGAYFFSQALNEEEAREEAGYMLSLLDGITLDLPLVFDEEIIRDDDARTDAMLLSQFTENALAFSEEVKAAGYTPMIYTNLLFECLIYDLEKLSDIPIWFAGYEIMPLTPYHFEFWQYSESGTIDGIEGAVDMNIWIRTAG